MNINNLILQLFSGAITGYITNSMAIKMLFKSYGPFGGVIVKTREEFIENISQLVERDIINENTLADSLVQSEVKESISKMVEHFFTEALQTRTEKTTIKQIPEIKITTNNLISHFDDNLEDYFLKGSQIFLPQIKLKQVVSMEQYDYISQQVTSQFLDILNQSKDLRINFNSLLSNLRNKEINSLVTPKLNSILIEKIKNILEEMKDNPTYLYKNLNLLKENLIGYLNIDKLNKELIKQIQDKTLKDYQIGEEYLNTLKNNLAKNITSPNAQKIINSISEDINESLIKDKYSVGDFIDIKQKNYLNTMMDKKIKGIIDIIKPWVINNHSRIDDIFNKIINNILEEESQKSPWKSAIKKSAYDYYRKNSNNSPAEILSSSLNKLVRDDSLNSKLENYLYGQLDNTYLHEILSYLQNIIGRQNKQNLANTNKIDASTLNHDQSNNIIFNINIYLSNYLSQLDKDKLEDITEKSISEIINLNNLNLDSLLNTLDDEGLQDYLLELSLTSIDKETNELIHHNKLGKFIDSEHSNLYYDRLRYSYKDKQRNLQKLAKKNLYNNNYNKTLKQLINPQVEEVGILYLKKTIPNFFKVELQKKSNNKINDLLKTLGSKSNFNEKVSNNLIHQINSNLPVLLKGNISAAIKNNLESVSDDNIKNIVEDFVGKELKPITYFGAFLGLCSAFLLYLLQRNTSLIPSFQLPVSMLVYGLIGYITNVIAIKMVFRPYDKKTLFHLSLPFTPGVVSKEKTRFAKSIGKFIDEELLNYNTVKNTIKNKKPIIKEIFTQSLTTEKYKLPRELLKQNGDKINDILFNNLQKSRSDFVEFIIKGLKNPSFVKNKDLIDSLSNSITKKIDHYIQHNLSLLSSALLDWIKSKDNLSSIIPESGKKNINIMIERNIEKKINSLIDLFTNNCNNNKFEQILGEFIDNIYEILKNKNLRDLPEETREILSNYLYRFLEKTIISKNNTVKLKLNNAIDKHSRFILNKIPTLILKNKNKLKDIILLQAKEKMGFWSAAGKLVDFDDTLDKFADIFIEEGLMEILDLFIDDKLDDIIKEFKFDEKEITFLLNGLFNNQNFKEFSINKINYFIEELSFITLYDLFKLFDIKKPSTLIKPFSKEINLIKNYLVENLSNNKKVVIKTISKAINEILDQYFYNIDINKLINNIDDNMLKQSLELLYKQLNTNDKLSEFINTIIKEIIISNSSKNYLINNTYLNTELNKLFDTIITSPMVTADLKKLINKIYIDLIEQFPEIIDKKTANYLIELLVTSITDTLEEGLPELIEKINIKEITITEIDNMEAKEIEQLFYSFAGNYFGKLENYGWLGGIIGLLSELIKNSI